MVRFWQSLIYPVLEGLDPSVIVEIGALKGGNTKNLLKFCAGKRQLHSIDPLPAFDVKKMREEHKGYFHFHKDLSLNVIAGLPKFEAALIDGDHNWYTVYNELCQISTLHEHNPDIFPVIFFHDIGWPYGRRDLYYSHTTIPEAFRQPFKCKGIQYNQSELSGDLGLNSSLNNAEHEGGPRNGVLTAIEDFIEQSSIEFTFHKIPVYFGIGIMYPASRIQQNKAFRQKINYVLGTKGLMRLLGRLETLRAKEMILMQEAVSKAKVLREQLDELKRSIES